MTEISFIATSFYKVHFALTKKEIFIQDSGSNDLKPQVIFHGVTKLVRHLSNGPLLAETKNCSRPSTSARDKQTVNFLGYNSKSQLLLTHCPAW